MCGRPAGEELDVRHRLRARPRLHDGIALLGNAAAGDMRDAQRPAPRGAPLETLERHRAAGYSTSAESVARVTGAGASIGVQRPASFSLTAGIVVYSISSIGSRSGSNGPIRLM